MFPLHDRGSSKESTALPSSKLSSKYGPKSNAHSTYRSSKSHSQSSTADKKVKIENSDLHEEALQALNLLLSAQRSAEGQLSGVEETHGLSSVTSPSSLTDLSSTLLKALHHTHKEGIQETTLILGASPSSSLFEGTHITITEYSTAPKIFNIQIIAQGKALAFFEAQAHSLLHNLRSSTDLFSVHRLEVESASPEGWHREKHNHEEREGKDKREQEEGR